MIDFEIGIIIFLTVTCCVLVYVCFNLLKKVERYELYVDTAVEDLDNYDKFFASAYERIAAASKRLDELDKRQVFEKDDDVGVVFIAIKKVFSSLERFLKDYGPPEEET